MQEDLAENSHLWHLDMDRRTALSCTDIQDSPISGYPHFENHTIQLLASLLELTANGMCVIYTSIRHS